METMTEPIELVVAEPAPRGGLVGFLVSIVDFVTSAIEWVFGVLTLIVLLAVFAAVPIFNFLTLGYLLEVAGRVGRSGRLRDGFIGVRTAAHVGRVIIGCYLPLAILQLMTSFRTSAELIEPGGRIARGWQIALVIVSILAGAHLALALIRGGKLRYFLWPFGNPFWLARRVGQGGLWQQTRDRLWLFVASLHLPQLFWLGVRGFAAGFCWLAVPVSLIAVGQKVPPAGFLGGLLLMIVLLWVPFLQTRLAVEDRFRAGFDVGAVRRLFKRAPWMFAISLLITLTFAVPLYLLRIELIPREATWLPSIVFLVFIFPSKLLTGWAYGLAAHRERPRNWFLRWTAWILMVAATFVYTVFVFFSQYFVWDGIGSLYAQHAFLLPVPFLP